MYTRLHNMAVLCVSFNLVLLFGIVCDKKGNLHKQQNVCFLYKMEPNLMIFFLNFEWAHLTWHLYTEIILYCFFLHFFIFLNLFIFGFVYILTTNIIELLHNVLWISTRLLERYKYTRNATACNQYPHNTYNCVPCNSDL